MTEEIPRNRARRGGPQRWPDMRLGIPSRVTIAIPPTGPANIPTIPPGGLVLVGGRIDRTVAFATALGRCIDDGAGAIAIIFPVRGGTETVVVWSATSAYKTADIIGLNLTV